MDSYREIENLIYQMTWLVDCEREKEMVTTLMKHATFLVPPHYEPVNAADMAKFAEISHRRWGPEKKNLTQHRVSNLWIEVDEEAGTAQSRCHLMIMQAVPEVGFPLQAIGCGTYHDTFKRHDDGKWWYDTHRLDWYLEGEACNHRNDFADGDFADEFEGRTDRSEEL